MKIDGRTIAIDILNVLKEKVLELKKRGIIPTMAVILIGDVESSNAYVKQKELKSKQIGAEIKVFLFDDTITNEELKNLIKQLDNDPTIHGIILQRPTPAGINVEQLEESITPEKEIDGFGKDSVYIVPVAGAINQILRTVFAYLELGEDFNNWLRNKTIIVIGKGETAGQPIIESLQKQGVEPTVIDSKTQNTNDIFKNADIIISAVGKRGVVKKEGLKNGVILIGVGLSADE